MFKHILVPTDGSALSAQANEAAVGFAKEIGARITAVTVSEDFVPPYDEWMTYARERVNLERASEEAARRFLASIEQLARKAAVPYEGIYVPNREPYRAIIQTAEEHACDLIFMASHGRRGMSSLLLGSVTQKVLTHCKIPVLVFRAQ